MNTCCKTSNPLRRDGTSQKQRFPIALSETYVQIDERKPADILNFIQQLAKEFNYYAGDNTVDGTWEEFFNEDLSFLLSQTLKVNVAAYRSRFALLLDIAKAEFEANGDTGDIDEKLEDVFQFFLENASVAESFPAMISRWITLFPDSALYAGDEAYSFRDLLDDGRKRLSTVLKKIRTAHIESDVAFGTAAFDLTYWATLAGTGWNIAPITPTYYYTSVAKVDDIPKLFDLLKAGMDTFGSFLDGIQTSIPTYILQSVEKFPWHNPQNALFLTFVRLFEHAQNHLNGLARRHLLYDYIDVLRFSQRPLVADQAVVVMQLRKGVEQFLLEKGTLLKAGKDIDGKAMHYAVDEEIVVNQTSVQSMMSIHVDRVGGDVKGIFASPIANSANGKGLPLNAGDPKWNLFGETQYMRLPADRTMPDARLGIAIASPLFMMKEGYREISASFVIKKEQFDAYNTLKLRAQLEANIKAAFNVEYTHAKGWATAELSEVILITDSLVIDELHLEPAEATSSQYVLVFRMVIDEGELPFVPYAEKFHQEGLSTPWPVLRLSLNATSGNFEDAALDLGNFILTTAPNSNAYYLYRGNIYNDSSIAPSNSNLVQDLSAFLEEKYNAYDELQQYAYNDIVFFNGEAYQANTTIEQLLGNGTANRNPEANPDLWNHLFSHCMYNVLQDFSPMQLHLKVAVTGAYGVLYENDFGKLKGEKPFPMFGGAPVIGSRFYVGSQEIFGKQLDDLQFNIVWQDPPDNLGLHYRKYEDVLIAAEAAIGSGGACGVDCNCCVPGSFESDSIEEMVGMERLAGEALGYGLQESTAFCYSECQPGAFELNNHKWEADISFLYDGQWEYLDRRPLFHKNSNGSGAKEMHTIAFNQPYFEDFEQDLHLDEHDRLESNTPRGFVRFELKSPVIAFGHKYFQELYLKAVHASSVPSPGPSYLPLDPPNEPYTPIVKEIRINYVSKSSFDFEPENGLLKNFNHRIEQFFHLHPFGHLEIHPYLTKNEEISLLPQYRDEGYLYIGLEGLQPPSTLSVLFQLAEGSGNPDLDMSTAEWSILIDNKWNDLERRDILLDTTDELITSGIIRFDFDADFNLGNTLLNNGLHWVRVKVAENTAAYMKAIDIVAQAVLVSFSDQDNDPSHLEKALPAKTINALLESDPNVKKVLQPFGSYGGKVPETSDTFLTRVSERLRHKQRSINIWDYERMVLEQFPSVYKVKCLNHTEHQASHTNGRDWEISPGYVTIVCIPDLRNLNSINPFEPKTSVKTMTQIDHFLHKYISGWVDLKVKNPLYEEIEIDCRIGFVEGKDPGFYTRTLEKAIQEYLSPWAFDHEKEIVFGGKIHQSQIIQFIEQQPYVDYVINFKMNHQIGDIVNEDVLEATATTGRSILVSSLRHKIISVKPDCAYCVPGDDGEIEPECCNDADGTTADSAAN